MKSASARLALRFALSERDPTLQLNAAAALLAANDVSARPLATDALLQARQGVGRGFVRQAATALAVLGDPSVLRREISRIERDDAPAPGAAPSNPLVFARAYALSADGKTEQAVAALQSIVTQDPRQAATHFSIGRVQERGGLIDDAIASYRRSSMPLRPWP